MKLLVRGLARSTSEESLLNLFTPFGLVQSCVIVVDEISGKSKGFGFVEMPKQGEAKVAVKTLNGQEIDGSKIRVKKAEPKPDAPAADAAPKADSPSPYGRRNLLD